MEALGFIGVVYLLAGIIQLVILIILIVIHAKEKPIIDENSDDFKQHLRKWKILKGKGYTDQAIKEYMEYTKRDMNSAVDFINSI